MTHRHTERSSVIRQKQIKTTIRYHPIGYMKTTDNIKCGGTCGALEARGLLVGVLTDTTTLGNFLAVSNKLDICKHCNIIFPLRGKHPQK